MIILLNENKTFSISNSKTIYQGENNADNMLFLIPSFYGDIDISTCQITMEWVNSNNEGDALILDISNELYKEKYLQATLPLTIDYTYIAGNIEMWVNITNSENELVLKSNSVKFVVSEHNSIEGTIPEGSFQILDQYILQILELEQRVDDYISTGVITEVNIGTTETLPIGSNAYVEIDSESTTNNRILNFGLPMGSIDSVAESTIIYVSKSGSDNNLGDTIIKPKLTITNALTRALTLNPSTTNRVIIQVVGGGVFTESFSVGSNISLDMPYGTLVGSIVLANYTSAIIDKHYASANNQNMVTKTGQQHSWYTVKQSDGRGLSGTLTGVTNIYNTTNNSITFARADIMFSSINGILLRDTSSDHGHLHLHALDCYLSQGGIALYSQGSGSDLIGYIDHILSINASTGTTGIRLDGADSTVKITINEIVATTAYNVTAGKLYLNSPCVTGTKVGTAQFDLSKLTTV